MPNHKAYPISEEESERLEIAEADALLSNVRTAVLFGVPGFERDRLFLQLLGSSLSKGGSLVLHSKPVVRAEILYDIVTNRDDLMSRAIFHYVPTLEEQERTLKRLSIDLSRMGVKTVLFDSPSDNYVVALALSMESQSRLKEVNASIVRHFAYLKTTALEMNTHILVTMGERSGINTVEEYLLRYWPDLIIKFRGGPESEAEFEGNENTKLSGSSARVITIGE